MSQDGEPNSSSSWTKKIWLWRKSPESPDPTSSALPTAPSTTPSIPSTPAPADFQKNFPDTKQEDGPSIVAALKTIKADDFLEVGKRPCQRDGIMVGIGAGTVFGGARWAWKGSIKSASNWAVVAGLLGAIASFERCQYLRRVERITMRRIVEVHREKTNEEKIKKEEELRNREAQLAAAAANKSWYKFW